jgi:hypothetical protein
MSEEKGIGSITKQEDNEILYFTDFFELGTRIKISALEAENRRILERLDALEKQIKN